MSIEIAVTVGELALTDPIGTRIVGGYGDEDQYEEPITLADVVVSEIVGRFTSGMEWDSIRRRVSAIRDEEIRAAVRPHVDEAIKATIGGGAKDINFTGYPVGDPVPLRDMVEKEAQKILGAAQRTPYNREQEPLLAQMVHDAVRKELTAEFREVIDAERAKLGAVLRAEGAKLFAELAAKGLGK